MEKLLIIGAGMLGINALHIARKNGFIVGGFIDKPSSSLIEGVKVLGDDSMLHSLKHIPHAIACIGNNNLRLEISQKLKGLGFKIPSLIHPSADICPGANVGEGCIIFSGVYIGPYARIGDYTVIEPNATLGPGCNIGSASLIKPLTSIHAKSEHPAFSIIGNP